jgi:predicted transcriptional regulator
MGILIAFAAGYAFGAKAGSQDFDDVVEALRAIRDSDEFHDLVRSLRSHAAHSLRELASILERASPDGRALSSVTTQDLVARVKTLVGQD